MKYAITTYCHISKQGCYVNGKLDFQESEPMAFAAFAKKVYKHDGIKYPKFFKMDELCKLAFLTTEKLLDDIPLGEKYDPTKVGIILANASSSLDTDMAYQHSMTDIPSPSLFVYTLPNIMLGELSIRHKLRGENACFVREDFDADWISEYVGMLLESGKIEACITGWIDKMGDDYRSVLFLIEPQTEKHTYLFNSHNLKHLYGSID